MADFILLHNPSCSKSRAAKAYLEEAGIDFEVRRYLDEPLSLDELRILKARLDLAPAAFIRFNEAEAKGLSRDAPPMELLAAIAKHPRILQRPILIHGDTAAIGRPGLEAFAPLLASAGDAATAVGRATRS